MIGTFENRKGVCDRTTKWLQIAEQDVRPDKSGAWTRAPRRRTPWHGSRAWQYPTRVNSASWARLSGLSPSVARGPSSKPGWLVQGPSFGSLGASRCFTSGLRHWGPWRSPRLYGVHSWQELGRPTCGHWISSLQLRYAALSAFLARARFCGRCSRMDTALRTRGGQNTNGCSGWCKQPLPPAKCRCWCRQCRRSAPSRQ